jgi:protoheme IX farnesyltransferase
LLPVVEPDGASTGRHVLSNSLALLLVALMPTMIGLAGSIYFFVALALGLGLVVAAAQLARSASAADARRLLLATLVYLPLLLVTMAADKLPMSPW